MCGIYALIIDGYIDFKEHVKKISKLLNHRGPDNFGHSLIKLPENNVHILLIHTRLQINGEKNIPQPIKNELGSIFLIINGEIFNWHNLEKELSYKCTESDCEIILPLYQQYKNEPLIFFNKLEGQFSFVLVDLETRKILVGRDPIGVTPLYVSESDNKNKYKSIVFSSEMKAITEGELIDSKNRKIHVFKPRSFYYNLIDDFIRFNINDCNNYISFNKYASVNQLKTNKLNGYIEENSLDTIHKNINKLLTDSVRLQLIDLLNNSNGDFGVLLSGGLDSSLIASLVVRLAKEMNYNGKIKTFSIGTNKESPDLKAAKIVADFLETEHYEYYFSIKEGLDSLKDVIWYIESYDCTSVRASTAMYLLTKQIKHNFPNLKVLYSGELSDELLCYLYGANAPNEDAFQDETVCLVSNVHYFDCLRANKTCMANNIEVRVPFTDIHYVNYILNLHPKYKRFGKINDEIVIEKKILRDAFKHDNYLPHEILYRKKEQFSDGISDFTKEYNWIDNLKEFTNNLYTANQFQTLKKNFTVNIPETNEHLYYRIIFNELFGNKNEYAEYTVKRWLPKWCDSSDPSGRVQSFYTE